MAYQDCNQFLKRGRVTQGNLTQPFRRSDGQCPSHLQLFQFTRLSFQPDRAPFKLTELSQIPKGVIIVHITYSQVPLNEASLE